MPSTKTWAWVWFTAVLYSFCILSGGVLLLLYFFHPTESSQKFSIIGLALLGVPWLIWVVTYLYRYIKAMVVAANTTDARDHEQQPRQPKRIASVAPLNSSESGGGSPVVSSSGNAGTADQAPVARCLLGNRDNNENSSVYSCESERPLSYSVS